MLRPWAIFLIVLFIIIFLSVLISIITLIQIQTFKKIDEYKNHKSKHEKINLKFIGKEILNTQIIETRYGNLKLYFWNKFANNLIIFVHGLASDAYTATKITSTFVEKDYCVLSYDNLGFGESKKFSSVNFGWKEALLLEDIYHWILKNQNNFKYKKIILYGESNGGATTIRFLNNNPNLNGIDKVIIDCGYISFWKPLFYLMKRRIGIFLTIFAWITMPFFILGGKYKKILRLSIENAKLIKKPVLVLQVQDDDWVDPQQIKLINKIAPSFIYHVYKNPLTKHCASMYDNREEYLELINNFLNKE